MTPLQKLLKNTHSSQKILPFVHITDAYGMMGIINDKKLIAHHCKVMNKELIYMFYGRPAYRTKHEGSIDLNANLPIALIFEPTELAEHIESIFPFDSGAFEDGLLSNFFHRRSERGDFALDGNIKNALSIVEYFYGTNFQYMQGGAIKNSNKINTFDFDTEGLLKLAEAKFSPSVDGTPEPDQRCNAIELQFNKEIDIEDHISHIIYPQIALENKEFRIFVSKLKNSLQEHYITTNGHSTSNIRAIFYEKVFDAYDKNGLFTPDN